MMLSTKWTTGHQHVVLSFVALWLMIMTTASCSPPKKQQEQYIISSLRSQSHTTVSSHRNLLQQQQEEGGGAEQGEQQTEVRLEQQEKKVEIQELSQELHLRQGRSLKKLQYDKSDHDYDNDPFFQSILVNGTESTSIYHYLHNVNPVPHHLATLFWNNDGKFSRNSSIEFLKWYEQVKVYEHNIDVPTNGNYNGTAALLCTNDIIRNVIWGDNITDIRQPPVPILVYTLHNQYMNHPYYKVIPNPYDMSGWNSWAISVAEKTTKTSTFQERINKIVWRGGVHGFDFNRQILLDMGHNPNNKYWLDAIPVDNHPENRMGFDEEAKYKYQIDIGGVTGTSWGGLRWKMCTGNLVFKVDTFSVDWWHHTIEPWIHYIPVNTDISNLYELYIWAESHPEEAYEIAQRGQEKCMETASFEAAKHALKETVRSLSLIPQSQDTIREAHAIMNGWGSFYEPIIRKREEEMKLNSLRVFTDKNSV